MAHPIIEEFCRIYSLATLQNVPFRRMQRIMRDEVQPMLDERDKLLVENAELRAQIEKLSSVTIEIDGKAVASAVARKARSFER